MDMEVEVVVEVAVAVAVAVARERDAAACAMAATHSAALSLSAAASSKVRSPLSTVKRPSLAEAFLASGVETMASARETAPRSEGRQRFSEGRR